MKVKRHRLYGNDVDPVAYRPSPNYRGNIKSHDYIVMHYTSGISIENSISWLTNRRARASAHLVIGRDGTVNQLVPLNKQSWHAGQSSWENRRSLNSYSIGIELDNAGKLTQEGGVWRNWAGHAIADDEVVISTHKNESKPAGWHTFSQIQIETALEVCKALCDYYPIKDIVGHDDIAPERKVDPGPAFKMTSFRSHIIGRSDTEDDFLYKTSTNLNIRGGPGANYDKIIDDSLPKGTRVFTMHNRGNWRFVQVMDIVAGDQDLEGWVHAGYLEK